MIDAEDIFEVIKYEENEIVEFRVSNGMTYTGLINAVDFDPDDIARFEVTDLNDNSSKEFVLSNMVGYPEPFEMGDDVCFTTEDEGQFNKNGIITDNKPYSSYEIICTDGEVHDIFDSWIQRKPKYSEFSPKALSNESMIVNVRKILKTLNLDSDQCKETKFSLESIERWLFGAMMHNTDTETERKRFKEDQIAAIFTVHDNDFYYAMSYFANAISERVYDYSMMNHPNDKKEAYFKEMWSRTCKSLVELSHIRSYHIVEDGPDLYEPTCYGDPEHTRQYLIKGFRMYFGDDALKVYEEDIEPHGGNGEYFLIDVDGNWKNV